MRERMGRVLDWLAQRRRTEAEWRDEREGQIVLCRYTHIYLSTAVHAILPCSALFSLPCFLRLFIGLPSCLGKAFEKIDKAEE